MSRIVSENTIKGIVGRVLKEVLSPAFYAKEKGNALVEPLNEFIKYLDEDKELNDFCLRLGNRHEFSEAVRETLSTAKRLVEDIEWIESSGRYPL